MLQSRSQSQGRSPLRRTQRFFLCPLILLTLLFSASAFFLPASAYAGNNFVFSFDSNQTVYSLPNNREFEISGDPTFYQFGDVGCLRFDGYNDMGKGKYAPSTDVKNFTLKLAFSSWQAEQSNEIIFILKDAGDYRIIAVGLTDANTQNPMLFVTLYWKWGVHEYSVQFNSRIQHSQWYSLIVTFNFNTKKYYSYLNGERWSIGNFTIPEAMFDGGSEYDLWVASYWRLTWQYFYNGYIDYVQFDDTYLPPYTATQKLLWYHFDGSGSETTVIDESGNGMHGYLNTSMAQWIEGGKYGHAASGSAQKYGEWLIQIPNEIPYANDKFSSSYWFKLTGAIQYGVAEGDQLVIAHNKDYITYLQRPYNRDAIGWKFITNCIIGGTTRSLTSPSYYYSSLVDKWLYLYVKYDGETYIFSAQFENNTVLFNVSLSCSGTITPLDPGKYSKYGFGAYTYSGTYLADYISMAIDEFKLTREILAPYQMNYSQWWGTYNQSKAQGALSENLWISATLEPNYLLCNPTGTAVLDVNSSGPWYVNMTGTASFFFDMNPPVIAIQDLGYASFTGPITIQFTAKNGTLAGTYSGQIKLMLRSNEILYHVELPFTLVVPSEEETPYIDTSSDWTIYATPEELTLSYPDTLTDYTIIGIHTKINGLEVDYKSLGFRYSKSSAVGYNATFVKYWWTEEISILQGQSGVRTNGYRFHYAIDSTVVPFGNFTVWHYVEFINRLNPAEHEVFKITIYVQSAGVTKMMWIQVEPSSLHGNASEVYSAKLRIYANYRTLAAWRVEQDVESWDTRYILVTGNPSQVYTNGTVDLQVKIPDSGGTFTCTIVAQDLYDATVHASCTLTVQGEIRGAFTFIIKPSTIYLDPSKGVLKFTATGQINSITAYTFCLNVHNNCSGLMLSYPNPVGYGKFLEFNIDFQGDSSRLVNGSYLIEFIAYANEDTSKYQSAAVQVVVTGAAGKKVTPTPTPENMTTISPTFGVTVYGMGTGLLYSTVSYFADMLGIAMGAMSFLFGLILLLLVVIGVAVLTKGALPPGVYVLLIFPVCYLNALLGLWDIWVIVIMAVFGIAILSFKAVQFFGGKKEEE